MWKSLFRIARLAICWIHALWRKRKKARKKKRHYTAIIRYENKNSKNVQSQMWKTTPDLWLKKTERYSSSNASARDKNPLTNSLIRLFICQLSHESQHSPKFLCRWNRIDSNGADQNQTICRWLWLCGDLSR